MKVLRVTSVGYERGGAENGMVLLRPLLEERGHAVRVFSSDSGLRDGRFSDYECTALSRQPFLLRIVYRIFYPHSYIALKKALRDFKPDVVQVHTLYELSPSVLFLLRTYPTIVTVHGAEEYLAHLMTWAFPKSFFKKGTESFVVGYLNMRGKVHYAFIRFITSPVYRFALRRIGATFLVMSRYMQEELQREGIEGVVCIENATELFSPVPVERAKQMVLYAGRLEKIKGVEYLMRAFAKIRERYDDMELVIAGSGPYRHDLERLAKELEVSDRVRFVGQRTREELFSLYGDARVVCVPSVWPEPFGKVGIEAMSVGRPVIASDVGGMSEWLVDGVTGYLVPPQDEHALAEKLRILFEDNTLLKEMSVHAVTHAQHFSLTRYADEVTALYEKVVREKLP